MVYEAVDGFNMHSDQNQEKVRNSIPPQPPLWTVCDTMTTPAHLPWAPSLQDRVPGPSECGPTAAGEDASLEVPTIGTHHSKLRRHRTVYLLVHWLRSKTRKTRRSVFRGIQTMIFGLAIQSAAKIFSTDVWLDYYFDCMYFQGRYQTRRRVFSKHGVNEQGLVECFELNSICVNKNNFCLFNIQIYCRRIIQNKRPLHC